MKKTHYILILPLLFAFTLHKYHLGNTKIVFNKSQQVVEITMRFFVDDIETSLNKLNQVTLELGNERELKNADVYLEKYLLENFKVRINNRKVTYKYLGNEVEKDIIYFYAEIDSITDIASIRVENTVLLEEFDDQQNIIRLRVNEKKKTLLLKKDKVFDSYAF